MPRGTKPVWFVTIAVLVIGAVICIALLTTSPTVSAPSDDEVIVTGDLRDGSAGCTAKDIAHRLKALFNAINQRDPDLIDKFFRSPQEYAFNWYSMSLATDGTDSVLKDHFVAYKIDDLVAYFRQRYAQHEHFNFTGVTVNAWQGTLVHFGPIAFTRSADDLPAGQNGAKNVEYTGTGKGSYDCKTQTFVVLSLETFLPE